MVNDDYFIDKNMANSIQKSSAICGSIVCQSAK